MTLSLLKQLIHKALKAAEKKKRGILGSWDLEKLRSKYKVFERVFNQPELVFPITESRLEEVYGQAEERASEAGLFPGNLAACTPWPEAQDLEEAGNLRTQ